jgi:hypothetical protein
VMTVATVASPLGLVAASQLLHVVSLHALFAVVASLLTCAGAVFAVVLLRNRGAPAAPAATPA